MHDDLRRRALESGKTTSNKAKSKQSSRASSRHNSTPGSRVSSRVQSRDASDDEGDEGNLSDETNRRSAALTTILDFDADLSSSINSIDALLESDDFNEQATDVLKQELHDCIDELLDRKSSNKHSREEALTTYVRILTAHHIADTLFGRVPDLLAAFSRSVKAETTERETSLALRAAALTSITIEDDSLWEAVNSLVKRTISDSQSLPVKVAAIHCLGICITFGGAGDEEIMETLTFLLEIASSDGSFVNAEDNADVVRAALQEYGFLVTQVDDIETESEDAIEVFMDQLDSSDIGVQIAAGENIALLYEKSFTPLEEDESPEDTEETATNSESDEEPAGDSSLVKRYNAYHNNFPIIEKVTALAGLSTKAMSKKDKKKLHQSFASIAMTVENPKLGLQTNNASKMTVRVHRTGEMKVDRWWKLMRLNALRRLLGGGFVNHYYEGNKQLLDALPLILRETGESLGLGSPRKAPPKATKGRFRDNRRFVSGQLAGE